MRSTILFTHIFFLFSTLTFSAEIPSIEDGTYLLRVDGVGLKIPNCDVRTEILFKSKKGADTFIINLAEKVDGTCATNLDKRFGPIFKDEIEYEVKKSTDELGFITYEGRGVEKSFDHHKILILDSRNVDDKNLNLVASLKPRLRKPGIYVRELYDSAKGFQVAPYLYLRFEEAKLFKVGEAHQGSSSTPMNQPEKFAQILHKYTSTPYTFFTKRVIAPSISDQEVKDSYYELTTALRGALICKDERNADNEKNLDLVSCAYMSSHSAVDTVDTRINDNQSYTAPAGQVHKFFGNDALQVVVKLKELGVESIKPADIKPGSNPNATIKGYVVQSFSCLTSMKLNSFNPPNVNNGEVKTSYCAVR